jgi:hypothetical protein
VEGPEIKERIMDFNRDYYRKYFLENKELPKLDADAGSLNWGKPPPPEEEKPAEDGALLLLRARGLFG